MLFSGSYYLSHCKYDYFKNGGVRQKVVTVIVYIRKIDREVYFQGDLIAKNFIVICL